MSTNTDSSTQSPLQTLFNSFFMIICTEIGDKTFLITAILAMRHSRLRIFLGAISSLVIMSILAAEMGAFLPTLIPAQWTPVIAAVLFLVFGAKMLVEGRAMEDDGSGGAIAEEMSEARKEIEVDDMVQDGFYTEGAVTLVDEKAEMGFSQASLSDDGETYQIEATAPRTRCSPKGCLKGTRNLLSLFLGPVFVQAFVLPFVSEWGDRSQIATIALGAAHNVYLVSIGTILGHAVCTTMAVLGGRYIADKISVKKMTIGGAALFIVFGLLYVWEAYAAFSSELQDY